MPIMTRMRDSMPVILFGLLIAFLVMIVFEWGMDYLGTGRGGRSDIVGKVNGSKVTYKEFSDVIKTYTDNMKAQGEQEADEVQMRQIRDQAWQTIVTQRLVEEEIKRFGITVTDQELVDWVRGDNPPEDLKRNFVDSTGTFRKDVYDQFLANPNQFIRDPKGVEQNFGTVWLSNYEKNLRQRRLQEKLQSIVSSSVRVSDGELIQRFADQNINYDAHYAFFDANTLVSDQDAQVSDADVKAYYEENIDQYKFEATRKLKFVTLLEKASGADSLARQKEIEDAAGKAKAGLDFLQLVATYSDKPDSGAFFKHGELNPQLESDVFASKVGAVVGPVLDNDGWHLVKVLEEKKSATESYRASHILLPIEGADSAAVKTEAQRLLREIRAGKDFTTLARQYSKDPGSAARGGDLGWFTKGRMVPAFESAVFKAKTGEVVGPVRTQFGLHIIKVTGRDARELKLAQVLIKVGPTSQTKNDLTDRAKDFAYNAKSSDFTKEAQGMGFEVHETSIQEKGGVVPGIGVNESITKWAFGAKVGAVSEPYAITNGWVVLGLAEIKDAGVRPFEELKESLKPLAIRKKKIERAKQLAADARAKLSPSDSLLRISQVAQGVEVRTTGQFTAGGAVPGIGRDANFIGAATGLTVGQISAPVQSIRGAYLIQLIAKSAFDSTAFKAQKESLRSRLLQEKRNRFLGDWLQKLRESADIEDHREQFFQ